MKQILYKTTDIFTSILFYAGIIIFFSAYNFQDNPPPSGWYQQWLPDLNGSTIKSMAFIDSLTGFAVTTINSLAEAYILKTTNGGDNWFKNYTYTPPYTNWYFVKISFVNSNTGYAFGWEEMFKTTNCGENWSISIHNLYAEDYAVVNKDTMLAVSSSGFGGGVFRTTNGGISWQNIWNVGIGSGNPSRIYMYDKNMGFSCGDNAYFRKTTNGGFNWTHISDTTSFYVIEFIDSLTGYSLSGNIKKSTDGGLTWYRQQPPAVTDLMYTGLSLVNKDTVWFVGPSIFQWGVICKTTNGGLNWGYQLPDTSIHIWSYKNLKFLSKKFGWSYASYINTGVHTTSGGSDTTFYTDINNNITTVPDNYVLEQNYPNPFNQLTIIKYKLKIKSDVLLRVYDIRGEEVATLVNKELEPGTYQVTFNGSNLSSGIYFYRLSVNGERIAVKKMLLVK